MTDPKPHRSALGDALRNTLATAATDAIATKLGGATHKATADPEGHTQAIADADADAQAGPDTITRDDIDTALGCLDAIAAALETIASAVQLAMEAANKPAPPPHRPHPAPR